MTTTFTPAPVDEKPLHPFGLGHGLYSCEHPERPLDSSLILDMRCRSCWLSAKAAVLNGRDHQRPYRHRIGDPPEVVPVSTLVERHAAFHGFGG